MNDETREVSILQVEVTGNRSQYKICTQLKYADTRSHVRVCTHHSVIATRTQYRNSKDQGQEKVILAVREGESKI